MAWSFACCSFYQKLFFDDKDKLAKVASTEDNNTPVILHIFTFATISGTVPAIAPVFRSIFTYIHKTRLLVDCKDGARS